MKPQEYSPPRKTPARQLSICSSAQVKLSQDDRFFNRRRVHSDFHISKARRFDLGKSSGLVHKVASRMSLLDCSSLSQLSEAVVGRAYPTKPVKILDAPNVTDDYSLNLLAWSEGHLAVGLEKAVYLWDVSVEVASQPYEGSTNVTAVSWMTDGRVLAVGDEAFCIHLIDVESETEVRTISCHSGRVSALAWNGTVLSSGSKDCSIVHNDLRMKDFCFKSTGHDRDVVGLAWNSDGSTLASGSKDGCLGLWEMSRVSPRALLSEHDGCLKAVAWCPWQRDLLASGGADECIRLWDSNSAHCTAKVNSESQVAALIWSHSSSELLSAHGFDRYHLALWSVPELDVKAEFTSHTARVLALAQNASGSLVASLGADETLCFWMIFDCDSESDESRPSPQFRCR
jgi:cell division cycle protein 20 (cofactor of APC complex)